MKRRHFWALGALPAAWVAAFWLGLAVAPGALTAGYIRAEIEAAKLLAFAGCVVAARAFSPGDYLRRAWTLLAACYACLLARDGLFLALDEGDLVFGLRHGHVQAFLSTVANAVGLVGSFMIARAWHVAGLEPFGRPAARRAALA
ncbi:MAG TPA: hypothetical protein VFS00_11255, partial [Polyangiaceae bacterium]|nr:hypothetical protein [Polyangiaceae bacterium]